MRQKAKRNAIGAKRMSVGLKEISPDAITLTDLWIAERTSQAMIMLHETVEIDPERMSGVPVLKGTRFTIPQLLAEIAEGRNVEQLAKAFTLDLELIKDFLHGLAIHLDCPVAK